MYLLLEGVDTCGKTTQLELLKQRFPDAVFTKEPGGTELGMQLREMILHQGVSSHKTELFLFLADRAEHYERIISQNIKKNIISDRGFISGIAYAMANHQEYDLDFLISLNRYALNEHLPDIVVLLKTNEKLILERMGQKREDMIEKRGLSYLLKVQEIMIDILKRLDIKYKIIDASASIDAIHQEIKGMIDD